MTSNARSSMAQSRYRNPGYLLPLVLGPLLRTSQVVADAASPTWRLFVLLMTALLAISAPAAAREPAPRAIIVLSPYLDTLTSLKLSVNAIENTFLFDTAGGSTVVTPDFAKSIGCKPWDRVSGFRMRGDRVHAQRCDHVQVDIGHLPANIPMVTVFDFSKLLPRDAPPLGGSLALDAFSGEIVTLDLAGSWLIVETPASAKARVRGAQEVPFRFAREVSGLSLTPLVAVETPAGRGGYGWSLTQTGSFGSSSVDVALRQARRYTRSTIGPAYCDDSSRCHQLRARRALPDTAMACSSLEDSPTTTRDPLRSNSLARSAPTALLK